MKLKELRKEKKLNQTDLGNLLGLTQRAYAEYEKTDNIPNVATLIKIADYYGVSLDYLCDHETKTQLDLPPLNEDQKTAIQMLVKLNVQNFALAYSRIAGLLVTQVN